MKDKSKQAAPGEVTPAVEVILDIPDVLKRHLSAFLEHDMETLLSDYTDESIMVTQMGTYEGKEEIRGFFTDLMSHFPKGRSTFRLDKSVAVDDMMFIVWYGRTPTVEVRLGTDTFLMRRGKIFRQTFAGELNFIG